MEGKFIFGSEVEKEKFISNKKDDIDKYKKLIKATEKIIDRVENQD